MEGERVKHYIIIYYDKAEEHPRLTPSWVKHV